MVFLFYTVLFEDIDNLRLHVFNHTHKAQIGGVRAVGCAEVVVTNPALGVEEVDILIALHALAHLLLGHSLLA